MRRDVVSKLLAQRESDIQNFVDMFNTTLKNLYTTLQTASGVPFISKCPKMVISGNIFSIY